MSLLFAFFLSAQAGELAGVMMPDTVTAADGTTLVLNGMGLREKFFFDIYVGGLYLPAKTTSEAKVIGDDVPKRMLMHFTYKEITKEQLLGSFDEAFAKDPAAAAVQAEIGQLKASITEGAVAGDKVQLDYIPGTGTIVTFKGKKVATIPGKAFMEVLWRVYVGPNPPTGALKKGLLGL